MEYNIRIELQDAEGKMLAGTTMSESHANAIKIQYGVDVLLDTVNTMKDAVMKIQAETLINTHQDDEKKTFTVDVGKLSSEDVSDYICAFREKMNDGKQEA